MNHEKPRTVEEVLDEALADPKGADAAPQAEPAMPIGFEQLDSDLTPEQIRKIRLSFYFWHTVGFFLTPVAFALRLGRWSMRTLVCHHNGHEFGGF